MSNTNRRISNADDAAKFFMPFSKKRVEHFVVATLNGAHEVIKTHIVSIGLVNRTVVHPREVFWFAIKDMAVAVIIGHNHPSGNLTPSPEDIDISKRLIRAGEILGIEVLDHILVSKTGFKSFVAEGLIATNLDLY